MSILLSHSGTNIYNSQVWPESYAKCLKELAHPITVDDVLRSKVVQIA